MQAPTTHAIRDGLLVAIFSGILTFTSATGQAADLTLTKEFLDAKYGFIDFKQIRHTLEPGDRVLLEGHTRPALFLVNLIYGTAENPIVVTNTGNQPFLIDDVGPMPNEGIKLWGVQHVVFRGTPVEGHDPGIKVLKAKSVGIDIDYNNYLQGRVAGDFENTTNLEISHVEIGNVGFAGIQAKYEMGTTYPENALLDGLHIHHTYIHDTEGEGMYLGWTFDGRPDIANVSVHHNILRRIGWDGIQLNRSRGENFIYDNIIDGYALTANTAPNGLTHWQNEGITVSGAKTEVYNNVVKASNQYSGSALFYSVYGRSRIYNNIFVHGGETLGGIPHEPGIYIRQISTGPLAAMPDAALDVANNTIVKPDFSGIHVNAGVSHPVRLYNNVIAEPLNGGRYVRLEWNGIPVTQAGNQFFASMEEAGFISDTDYRPAKGSPLVDAGIDLTSLGITNDYNGVPRPQGSAFDVGAYEQLPSMVLITPEAWGTAVGGAYCGAPGAFNSQPTWDNADNIPVGNEAQPHADTGTAYVARHWYIDFGEEWAKIRLTSMWTRYRPYSGGSYAGFESLWWDDDNDNQNDGTPAVGLNFATAQNISHMNAQQWVPDRTFDKPVVPLGRYLVISTGAAPTNRASEFAFVGYRVN